MTDSEDIQILVSVLSPSVMSKRCGKLTSISTVGLPRLSVDERGKGSPGCPDTGGDIREDKYVACVILWVVERGHQGLQVCDIQKIH